MGAVIYGDISLRGPMGTVMYGDISLRGPMGAVMYGDISLRGPMGAVMDEKHNPWALPGTECFIIIDKYRICLTDKVKYF